MAVFRWKIIINNEEIVFEETFNPESYEQESDEISTGSTLLNLHAAYLMRECVRTHNYESHIEERHISLHLDEYEEAIDFSKYILARIESSKRQSLPNEDLCREIKEYIQMCRDHWNDESSVFVELTNDRERFPRVMREYYINNVRIINEKQRDSDNSPTGEEQPYHEYYSLAKKINPSLVEERYEMMKTVSYAKKYYPKKGEPLKCQVVIDDQAYTSFLDDASDSVIDYCQETTDFYLSVPKLESISINDSITKLQECINKERNGQRYFGKYRNGKGCFGLLEGDKDTYLALSGPFDVQDKDILNYLCFNPDKDRSNKDLQNNVNTLILNDPYFSKAIYSEMNKGVKRYPCTIPNSPRAITVLQSLEEAMNASVDKDEIKSDYSCCERKMFSKLNYTLSGSWAMFTRRAPCPKCIPAIKDVLNKNPGSSILIYFSDEDNGGQITNAVLK